MTDDEDVGDVIDVIGGPGWAAAATAMPVGPMAARERLMDPASSRRTGATVTRSATATRTSARASRRTAPRTVTTPRYQQPPTAAIRRRAKAAVAGSRWSNHACHRPGDPSGGGERAPWPLATSAATARTDPAAQAAIRTERVERVTAAPSGGG